MSNLVANNNSFSTLKYVEEYEKCEEMIDEIISFLYGQSNIPKRVVDWLVENIEQKTMLEYKIANQNVTNSRRL